MRRNGIREIQDTANVLKEKCDCKDKRIGKERLSSIMVVEIFDKKTDDYKPKKLKRNYHTNENNSIRTTRNRKDNYTC